MNEGNFLAAYRRLNPAQKQAVEAIEGPVMVVAGPGTGKTEVLTLRIANILRLTDTPPEAILALTFTNSGVHSMRQRLVEIIGSRAWRVNLNTFHGFCNELIQNFPEEFPRIVGARHVNRVEQIKILERAIRSSRLKVLRPYGAPFYFLPAILSAIEKLKKENISPGALAKQVKGERERELALIYRFYQGALRRARGYDFTDMIMEALAALKKKSSFLRQIQEECHYLLADEHQDANQSQNELLARLASFHSDPNLFIVGDEKQAIFQFQGASLDNFNFFRRLYPRARLISLTASYRSPQPHLDAAQTLIVKSRLPASTLTPLTAADPSLGAKIKVGVFSDPEAEKSFLVQDIKVKIAAGLAPAAIAVIYRDNAEAAPLAEALERAGLPVVIQSEADLLTSSVVRKLILVFQTIQNFGAADYLARFLLLDFLNLEPLAVYRLLAAGRRRGDLYETLRRAPGRLGKIYRRLAAWHRLATNESFLELFGAILAESGFREHLLRRADAVNQLAKLQSFFEEIKELASGRPHFSLTDFLEFIDTLTRHNLSLRQTVLPTRPGLRLLTAHKSKGLEFEEVYLVGAAAGHFGQRRRRSVFTLPLRGEPVAAEDDEAERRLFYVALTRARRGTTITYARHSRSGRPQLPSQFIEEIDKNFLEYLTVPEPEAGPGGEEFKPRPADHSELVSKTYLNKLFLERGFSATDLNNYLDCPLKYFYQNLLRLTRVQEKYLLYGTAVHQTLKDFFDRYRVGGRWPAAKMLARFKFHLDRQPFVATDLADSWAKGRRALAGYLQHHRYRWPDQIINEYVIRGVDFGRGIKLNGKIDKLEFVTGENRVRVVDYKTSLPQSRNHILGKTKGVGSGNYFRQLVFYKILLASARPRRWEVPVGLIDFVEPDKRGRYRQEEFALEAEAVRELEELIRRVSADILALKFFRAGCGKKDCADCELWSLTGGK